MNESENRLSLTRAGPSTSGCQKPSFYQLNLARKTANLAFPGQTVNLHLEFQIGAHDTHGLNAELGRADTILASVQTTVSLRALKLRGWTDAEWTAFTTVRGSFPASTKDQQSGQSDAKKATRVKDTDAAGLYDHVSTIHNAANLEFPATSPASAPDPEEFRLNTVPPDNHTPPPTPTPPTKQKQNLK
jgi:hypothetical protein